MKKNILIILLFVIFSLAYLFYDANSFFIVEKIRIPKYLLCILTGFALAIVGYIYQIMLNNPLAEPFVFGISSFCALGIVLSYMINFYIFKLIFGAGFSFLGLLLIWSLANYKGNFSTDRLILIGVILNFFAGSFISLIMYLNKREISNIFSVLMGDLENVFSLNDWFWFKIIFIVSLFIIFFLILLQNKIEVLGTGDLMSASVGVDAKNIRKLIFVLTSILLTFVVNFAGIIGFIGIIIPHIARKLNYKMKMTGFLGILYLLICDFLASHLLAVILPVGIITSFLGAPFFIWIILKNKN